MLSLYSSDCFSNSSKQGMETTRALMPSSASCAFALTQSSTSEPVASSSTSGVPSQSSRTYAPFNAASPLFSY